MSTEPKDTTLEFRKYVEMRLAGTAYLVTQLNFFRAKRSEAKAKKDIPTAQAAHEEIQRLKALASELEQLDGPVIQSAENAVQNLSLRRVKT